MIILKMFDYQTWADERVIYFLSQLTEVEKQQTIQDYTSIKQRMAHIVLALEV